MYLVLIKRTQTKEKHLFRKKFRFSKEKFLTDNRIVRYFLLFLYFFVPIKMLWKYYNFLYFALIVIVIKSYERKLTN